ncbi:4,5-epoxidase [Ancylobacter aquaticus]|uniref:4,5-epoxidase n=1 Tax=Ancylobacter aquaticus TaxID=100 RepID=A0A4V2PJL4_ANCAQ|nr:FAD-dependent monooxygenase [Ancylobacter aquaticus]TCK29006.1 4,5-epoxidase [Ancylobacter aquaticus]
MVADVDVLVVGAGPTGLLLAAELVRRGVGCLLIDEHDRPLSWDRATVVHPRSVEIFDALGLAGPLLEAGVRQRMARIHSDGAVLGEIDLALSGSRFPFNVGVSEEVTEGILTRHLEGFGGRVTRGTRLVGLEEQDEQVMATVRDKAGERTLAARWVVGCDGHHSLVRTLAGIEQDGHAIEEPWAVFDAAIDGWPHSHEGNFAYFDSPPIILTALPGQRWRVYVRPSAENSDLVADASLTLKRYLPDAAFSAIANPVRFHCYSRVARQYRAGRLLLAGDAAHTCSPLQGHGMNTGLQDAFNLGWKLALVSSGHCAETLLDSYEAERRPVAQKVTDMGDEMDRAQLFLDAGQRLQRDAAIRGALSDPVTRHQEATAEAELDIDYRSSPIVIGSASDAGVGAGALWPHHPPAAGHAGPDMIAARAGHMAVLVAGAACAPESLADLQRAVARHVGGAIVEMGFTLSAHGTHVDGSDGLDPALAERLGVEGLALFIVRPDGYLGLRADERQSEALASYVAALGATSPA